MSGPKFTIPSVPAVSTGISLDPRLSPADKRVIAQLSGEHGRCTREEIAQFHQASDAALLRIFNVSGTSAGPRRGIDLDRALPPLGKGLGSGA